MSTVLNLSLIEGRLTKDPELLYTKNGNAICKFDIAVNSNLKRGGEVINQVSFIAVNTWNKVAECCVKYLKKGSLIRANGRLKQTTWANKDGKKMNKTFIEAASIEFLGGSNKSNKFKERTAL